MGSEDKEEPKENSKKPGDNKENKSKKAEDPAKSGTKEKQLHGFWLTRIVFLRSLAFIYCK